jgi:hypothetical protein
MGKEITFSFGRLNPPTTGHGKLLDALSSVSSGEYRMYLSKSHDSKKNPLSLKDKVKFIKKMFPKHSKSIVNDDNIRNVFDILVKLYDDGFNAVVMVVGSDRVNEFKMLMDKYNDIKSRHGYYNFTSIEVKSAGKRDPDSDGVVGMSASKMRVAAVSNDYDNFKKGLPSNFKDGKLLFDTIRKNMNVEEHVFDFLQGGDMLSEYFDCVDAYDIIESTQDNISEYFIIEELYKYNSYLNEKVNKFKNLKEIGEKNVS